MKSRLRSGFTLLEVMITLAIIGGLLVTLMYTLNYHLGIAGKHEFTTVAVILAKGRLTELETRPEITKGAFPSPYSDYSYESQIGQSSFPDMSELSVVVRRGKDEVKLSELIEIKK